MTATNVVMAAEMKSVGKDGELAQTTRRPPSDHVTSSQLFILILLVLLFYILILFVNRGREAHNLKHLGPHPVSTLSSPLSHGEFLKE